MNIIKFTLIIVLSLLLSGCNNYFFITEETTGETGEVYDTKIRVYEAEQLSGVLESNKIYIIDGVIDMGNISIVVPSGGVSIVSSGQGAFGVSGFSSSEEDYTLFTYEEGSYSGNLFLSGGLEITLTGENSSVFNLFNNESFGVVEIIEVNYNSCSRIGTLSSYRQVLSQNVAVFGCEDGYTFEGNWSGGVRMDTILVRNFGDNGTFFKAGEDLVFNSRFFTDLNIDLGDNSVLSNFHANNFALDSLFQIQGATITRNGIFETNADTLLTNTTRGDLTSNFQDNTGLRSTVKGGRLKIVQEQQTSFTANNQYKTIQGTYQSGALQHFDNPTNGRLRYLGSAPIEVKVVGQLVIESFQNDQIGVRVRKYDASCPCDYNIGKQEKQVNSFVGGRDVAFFDLLFNTVLDENDYIFLQVANVNGQNQVVLEDDSFIFVEEN